MTTNNVFLLPRLQTSFLKIDEILHPLYEGVNTIGRTKNATVVIKNENVSQHHAIITVIRDKHYLSDVGSINGTSLNKNKLQSLLLYELSQDSNINFACVSAVYIKNPSSTQLSNNNSVVRRNTQDLSESIFLGQTQPMTSTNTQNINCFDDDYNFADVPIEDNVERSCISIHDMATQIIDIDAKKIQNPENPEFDIHELPTQIFDEVTKCSSNQLVVVNINTSEGVSDTGNVNNSSSETNNLLEPANKINVADVLPETRSETSVSNLIKSPLNKCDENDDSYCSVRKTQFDASDIVEDSLLNDSGFDIKKNDIQGSNNEIIASTSSTEESDVVHPIGKKCVPLCYTESLESQNDDRSPQNSINASQGSCINFGVIALAKKKKNCMVINSDSETDDELINQAQTTVSVLENPEPSKQNINSGVVETDIDLDITQDNIISKQQENSSDSDTDIEDMLPTTSTHKEGQRNFEAALSGSDTDMEDLIEHAESKPSQNATDLDNEQINDTDIVPETQMSDNDDNDFDFGIKENSTMIDKNIDNFSEESFSLKLSSYIEFSEETDTKTLENSKQLSGVRTENLEDDKSGYLNNKCSLQPSTSNLNSDFCIPQAQTSNSEVSTKPQELLAPKQPQEVQKELINVCDVQSNTGKKVVCTKFLSLSIESKTDSSCLKDEFNQQIQDITENAAAVQSISDLNDSDVFSGPTQKIITEDRHEEPTQIVTQEIGERINLGHETVTQVRNNFNGGDLFDQPTQILCEDGTNSKSFEQSTGVMPGIGEKIYLGDKAITKVRNNFNCDDLFDQSTQILCEDGTNSKSFEESTGVMPEIGKRLNLGHEAVTQVRNNFNRDDLFDQPTQTLCEDGTSNKKSFEESTGVMPGIGEKINLGDKAITKVRNNFNCNDLFDQPTQILCEDGTNSKSFEESTGVMPGIGEKFNLGDKTITKVRNNFNCDDLFDQPTQILCEDGTNNKLFEESTQNIEDIKKTSISNNQALKLCEELRTSTDDDIFDQQTQKFTKDTGSTSLDSQKVTSNISSNKEHAFVQPKQKQITDEHESEDIFLQSTQRVKESGDQCASKDVFNQPTQAIEEPIENDFFDEPTQQLCSEIPGDDIYNQLTQKISKLQEKRESEIHPLKVVTSDCSKFLSNNSKKDEISTAHPGTSVESQLEVMFASQPLQYIPVSEMRPLNPLSVILEQSSLNSPENENSNACIDTNVICKSSSSSVATKNKNRSVNKEEQEPNSSNQYNVGRETNKEKSPKEKTIQSKEPDVEKISRLKKLDINRTENAKSKCQGEETESSDSVSSALTTKRNKKQVKMCLENKTLETNIGINEKKKTLPKNTKSKVTTRRNNEQCVSSIESVTRANISRNEDREANSPETATKSVKVKKGVDFGLNSKSLEHQNVDGNQVTGKEMEIKPIDSRVLDKSKDVSMASLSASTKSSVRKKRGSIAKDILPSFPIKSIESIENDTSSDTDEFENENSTRNRRLKCNTTKSVKKSTKLQQEAVIEITDESNEDDQQKTSMLRSKSNKRKETNLIPPSTPIKKKKVETSIPNSRGTDSIITTRRGKKLQDDSVDVNKNKRQNKTNSESEIDCSSSSSSSRVEPIRIRKEKQIIIEIIDSNEEEQQKVGPRLTRTNKRKDENSTDSDTLAKKTKLTASSSKRGTRLQSDASDCSKKLRRNETTSESEVDCSSSSSNSKILGTPSGNKQHDVSFTDTPTRNKRKLKPKIVFTMLNSPELESLIRSLGGMIVDSVSACTVLVTQFLKRSQKLLSAVGQGKPICSPKWLYECKKANTFLDPWDFILEDKEAEAQWNVSLKESLKRGQNNKLLANYSVHLMVHNATDVLKAAVESCGGKCISKVTSRVSNNILIVSTVENRAKYLKFLQRIPPVTVVTPEAIFDGVLRQELQFKDHLLS